jgi:hypothetical protein
MRHMLLSHKKMQLTILLSNCIPHASHKLLVFSYHLFPILCPVLILHTFQQTLKLCPVCATHQIVVLHPLILHKNHRQCPMHIIQIHWYKYVSEVENVPTRHLPEQTSNIVIIVPPPLGSLLFSSKIICTKKELNKCDRFLSFSLLQILVSQFARQILRK